MNANLQMMPGGMPTPGSNWGSMWLTLILPSLVVGLVAIVIVVYFLRREGRYGSASFPPYQTQNSLAQPGATKGTEISPNPANPAVLAEVIRSLAPTLSDDERRVMDELVKAGGEVLQSDLPRMTGFSKATVSKAINGLEVRAIVVREKHKWTYWCKVNPRLIERTLQEQPGLQENRPINA